MSTDFSDLFPKDLTYDKVSRQKKADKIYRVIKDKKSESAASNLSCLDYGCSHGLISFYLSKRFKKVVGADVDIKALNFAKKNYSSDKLKFVRIVDDKLPIKEKTFDVVVLNQVYEHADHPERLLREVWRVLKDDGICYFGARNKNFIFDGHYSIPLISLMSKNLQNKLINLFYSKDKYDITLLNLNDLKRLVKSFKVTDYTGEVIKEPKKYGAQDAVPTQFGVNKLIYTFLNFFYQFVPNYIWVLEKK